ncbi:MAG: hypothetical protein DMF59_08020 [Acidobacteria bacterium]|nr:MAG: hypothetical protein DMF59_08020 [Acidobacteriota bacterium]
MDGWEGRRRISPRRRSFRTIALLMLTPVVGLLAILVGIFVVQSRPVLSSRLSVLSSRHPRRTENRERRTRARIVLIIDDVGFDRQPRHALEDANLLHDRGFEVLCHLPMEPEQFPRISPGEGAVLTSMSDAEIARTTAAGLQAVPYARGVNNHMGSRATADRRVMESVLDALPAGMYFVDSRTTGSSVAAAVARERRIRTATRNVFLDDVANEVAVRQQLRELAREADAHGVAIGIGHMYPATVRVLLAEVPALKRQGFRFVRASEAVR